MARIKNQILGNVSGFIGPVVFKMLGTTQYIARKPASFIPGTDSASVFRRDQGAFVGKLSSKIYSIDIIKKFWKHSVQKQFRIYQKIWSENYHAVNCNDLNRPPKFTPTHDFLVNNPSFLFAESSFTLKSDPIGVCTLINPALEKFVLPVGVIVLKEPKAASSPKTEIIPFIGKNEILDLSSPLYINIDLPVPEATQFNRYKFHKCYLILITQDDNEQPVHCSNCLLS
jgi:hypothetical protein